MRQCILLTLLCVCAGECPGGIEEKLAKEGARPKAPVSMIGEPAPAWQVDAWRNLGEGRSGLEAAFRHPGESAKPWVYWYWMQANATRDGITRDLEAMAEVGIGGAYLMPIGKADERTLADPPANPLSDDWWQLVVHAAREADRLGLRLAMNACDGWALAGGPWITPELSMQEVVTATHVVEGGRPFEGTLTSPPARLDYYRDIAVLAYPADAGTGVTSTKLRPKATTSIPGLDPQVLVEGASQPVTLSAPGWIQYEFAEPFTCRSIRMSPDQRSAYHLHRVEVQVSHDGQAFRSRGRLTPSEFHGWQDRGMDVTHAVVPTTARFFRFVFDRSGTPPASENREGSKARNRDALTAAHIELFSEPRIVQWEGKAGYRWRRSEWTTAAQCPTEHCVPTNRIIDLTGLMTADGTLRWTPPPGRWTIQRIGYTTTGEGNNPSGTGGGLECDKFNPVAAGLQFNRWFGEALDRVGQGLAGRVLWRNHTDSWEASSQNWSPAFRDEFIRRRGYDPLPWLPAMSGVPVGSAELSERFLFDVRRTIADLVCDNFYGPLTAAGRGRGAEFTAECIAPTMMADGLQHFQYADMPMGEFWLNSANQDKPNDIQDAICGGHIYGKRVIGAEAFTQNPIHWNEDPYYLKPLGDYQFARGINRFVLHVWAHQAFDRQPGMTLNAIGTFFSGSQTWHQPGKAWFDYVQRCSGMLQQGLPVADVCYFIGEELPSRSYLRHDLPLPLPEGYSYVCINRDALLTRAQAREGRLVLPDGMSCRMLVLPPSDRMTPAVAKKIGDLARAGVPVLGAPPTRSPSLSGYPDCDAEVQAIVRESWGSVRTTASTEQVLAGMELPPDVVFRGVDMTPVLRARMEYSSPPFAWTHRQDADADVYFLSNQERTPRCVDVIFRGAGRVPELWDAARGAIRDADGWRYEGGRTIVPLRFDPAGSVFVVFRRPVTGDAIARIDPVDDAAASGLPPVQIEGGNAWISLNGEWQVTRQSGRSTRLEVHDLPAARTITTPWTVTFPPGRGAPEGVALPVLQSLSAHTNAGVRYFSGTATYVCRFDAPAPRPGDRLFLDLGGVANLAEVTLNATTLGVLWKPPFVIEVTPVVRGGTNTLAIKVTNTWRNRLIGDAGLPAGERTTWLWSPSKRTLEPLDVLDPSGLLGPVVLRTVRAKALE